MNKLKGIQKIWERIEYRCRTTISNQLKHKLDTRLRRHLYLGIYHIVHARVGQDMIYFGVGERAVR